MVDYEEIHEAYARAEKAKILYNAVNNSARGEGGVVHCESRYQLALELRSDYHNLKAHADELNAKRMTLKGAAATILELRDKIDELEDRIIELEGQK